MFAEASATELGVYGSQDGRMRMSTREEDNL